MEVPRHWSGGDHEAAGREDARNLAHQPPWHAHVLEDGAAEHHVKAFIVARDGVLAGLLHDLEEWELGEAAGAAAGETFFVGNVLLDEVGDHVCELPCTERGEQRLNVHA